MLGKHPIQGNAILHHRPRPQPVFMGCVREFE